jgi:hypothetical protein
LFEEIMTIVKEQNMAAGHYKSRIEEEFELDLGF